MSSKRFRGRRPGGYWIVRYWDAEGNESFWGPYKIEDTARYLVKRIEDRARERETAERAEVQFLRNPTRLDTDLRSGVTRTYSRDPS